MRFFLNLHRRFANFYKFGISKNRFYTINTIKKYFLIIKLESEQKLYTSKNHQISLILARTYLNGYYTLLKRLLTIKYPTTHRRNSISMKSDKKRVARVLKPVWKAEMVVYSTWSWSRGRCWIFQRVSSS